MNYFRQLKVREKVHRLADFFDYIIIGSDFGAHILGGCPMGKDASKGVIDESFQVHNYPGLYIVDGSVMPANPGVNPSLTITALAEYAMNRIPENNHK